MRPRTSWTVDNLADWLAKYDSIHKLGTMQEPYNYETWKLIVQDVALDYAEIVIGKPINNKRLEEE